MASPRRQGMNWIRKERRLAIYIRDNFTCLYCGRDLKERAAGEIALDHLHCRVNGGGNENSNLITACRSCNSSRQDREWRQYATGGAIERIEEQIRKPVNVKLAKALIDGTAGDPASESER